MKSDKLNLTIKKRKKIKIAFLDRDGVLNSSKINRGYIGLIKDFKWVPGAKKTIKFLKKKNYKIVIITNQSGIARGYFSLFDVYKLHNFIKLELIKFGTKVDKIIFCPFHENGIIKKYKKKSNLRKPGIGMFLKINKIWKVDRKSSFIIGDQLTDMQFAKKANIKGFLFNEGNLYNFFKKKVSKFII
jgi:D-glycero-D-manno-heptose 1,7-bisphosphate phosphatase|tara:strand:+ start:171 stop:731 length:561 start_codon:yes stop_codon:yes gene_type:complete